MYHAGSAVSFVLFYKYHTCPSVGPLRVRSLNPLISCTSMKEYKVGVFQD